MPRGPLILLVIGVAFGVGFAARSVIDQRLAPSTPPDLGNHSPAGEETLEAIEARALASAPPAAVEPTQPLAPIQPAAPSPPQASASPPAPEATAALQPPAPTPSPAPVMAYASPTTVPSAATPSRPAPSTGMSQLAYAPILPETPNPMADPALAPPPAPVAAPPLPSPTPQPAKLDFKPFPAVDIDALRDVIAQIRKGDIAAADGAAKRLTDPVMRTLAEWMTVRSGQRAVSFPRILAFIEKEPSFPTQPLLQRRAEEALSAENRPAAAVRSFFANRTPVTVGGRIALARALRIEGQRDEAIALIRKIWREDQFSDETEDRLVAEFSDALRREDHRARMERYLFKEMTAKALRAANRAGADHAALVRVRQAVENKAKNAKALLDAIPATLRNDSSYVFARAQHMRRTDQAAEAVKAMEGVSRDPAVLMDGDEWWVERRLIARKLLDIGNPKLAYKAAAEHGAASEAMRIEAEFHAGWIALQFLNDPVVAATHFDKAAEFAKTPMSVSRVAYWQGRAAAARKDMPAAEGFYRRAASHGAFYYGQLARARIPNADFNATTSAITDANRGDLEKDRALRAVDLFLAMNEREFAISLIFDLAQRSGEIAQLEALGDILTTRNDARAILMMGKLAMQRGLALDRHAFPTFGVPSFPPLGQTTDQAIVHSIARQESAFDPRAVSHAGARGLMQLMPATARMTANRYKAPFEVGRLTSDPVYNAQIGAAHLNDLIEEWRGSYILVFAAYNAGSHNVKKWIDAYGDPRGPAVDPIDWIERIPFTETRNYVQRIMENVQVYRSRLSPGSPLTIEADLRRGSRPDVAPRARVAGDPPLPPMR